MKKSCEKEENLCLLTLIHLRTPQTVHNSAIGLAAERKEMDSKGSGGELKC